MLGHIGRAVIFVSGPVCPDYSTLEQASSSMLRVFNVRACNQ